MAQRNLKNAGREQHNQAVGSIFGQVLAYGCFEIGWKGRLMWAVERFGCLECSTTRNAGRGQDTETGKELDIIIRMRRKCRCQFLISNETARIIMGWNLKIHYITTIHFGTCRDMR